MEIKVLLIKEKYKIGKKLSSFISRNGPDL